MRANKTDANTYCVGDAWVVYVWCIENDDYVSVWLKGFVVKKVVARHGPGRARAMNRGGTRRERAYA